MKEFLLSRDKWRNNELCSEAIKKFGPGDGESKEGSDRDGRFDGLGGEFSDLLTDVCAVKRKKRKAGTRAGRGGRLCANILGRFLGCQKVPTDERKFLADDGARAILVGRDDVGLQ